MRKFTVLMALLFSVFGAHNASAETPETTTAPKILIAYYSWSGNTKEVAEAIHEKVGGDMFEIQTVESYPEEYKKTTAQAKKEINEGYHPKLKGSVENIGQYDVIFLGSPNWWGTIAPAVSTFLAENNLEGKTVVPFITHGAGGKQNTIDDLTAQCKKCNVTQDGWVGFRSRTWGISGWLEDLGYVK